MHGGVVVVEGSDEVVVDGSTLMESLARLLHERIDEET